MAYAPGIQRKGNRGRPTEQLMPGQSVSYFLQRHRTRRNPMRPHLDLRLGTPDTGLFSWAVPAGELPSGRQKRLAPQTEVHDYDYGGFSGNIGRGYGAGHVQLQDRGDAIIHKVSPHSITFTLAHTRVPVRYMLIHMDTEKGNEWLLMQKTPKGIPEIGDKPTVKLIEAADMDAAIDQAKAIQEKIDGAHTVFDIGETGDIEAYSVRRRSTGDPIVHTERLGLSGVTAPDLAKTRFRGEAFGAFADTGTAVPFKDFSGLMNASLAKARQLQAQRGIELRVAPFKVTQFRGEDVSGLGSDEQRAMLEQIVAALPQGRAYLPRRATTPEEKRQLVEEIRAGQNPATREGVILDMDGQQAKIKFRPDTTGYLRGTYPPVNPTGKRKELAGGLLASLEPAGEPNIRIGTGFTDRELADIVGNIKAMQGKPIRINYQEKFPSGLLRAPSWGGFEADKVAQTKEAGVKARALAAVLAAMQPGIAKAQQAAPAINMAEYEISPLLRNIAKLLPKIQLPQPTSAPGYATNAMQQVQNKLLPPVRWATSGHAKNFTRYYEALEPSLQRAVDRSTSGVASTLGGAAEDPLRLAVRFRESMPPLLRVEAVTKLYERDPVAAARLANSMIRRTTNAPPAMIKHFAAKQGAMVKEVPMQVISSTLGKPKARFTAEVADTEEARRAGLSKRADLPEGRGMFFDTAGPFWMKDVVFPLDLVHMDKSGEILDIQTMKPDFLPDRMKKHYWSMNPKAAYAVELPGGWCESRAICPGDRIVVGG